MKINPKDLEVLNKIIDCSEHEEISGILLILESQDDNTLNRLRNILHLVRTSLDFGGITNYSDKLENIIYEANLFTKVSREEAIEFVWSKSGKSILVKNYIEEAKKVFEKYYSIEDEYSLLDN